MRGGVAAALAREAVVVDAPPVDVIHKNIAAIFGRPIVAQINHRAAVRVAAAGHILLRRADPCTNGFRVRKMQMIGNGGNAFIGILAGRPVALGIVKRALDDVKEMRVHAVAHEGVAEIVPVDAPRVGGANGEGLPHMPHRMIPPHAALEAPPFGLRRAGLAEQRPVRNPVRAVQPTIRPPRKPIGDGVRIGMRAKAVEQHHRFTIRHAVVILVRDKIKIRNRHHPHPAEPHLNAAHVLELIIKNNPLVVPPIAIGVLENDDAILLPSLFVRIIIGFGHPQPATVINAETDRLLDIRFTGKKGHVESLGHLHGFSRFQWREGFLDDRLRILLGTPKMRSAKNGK